MGLKKITSDDLENTILNPLENYLSSFKSEYTKERYTRILKGYMMNTLSDLIDGETFEEKVVSLVNKARKDPQWVLSIMVTISKKLRTRTKKDPADRKLTKEEYGKWKLDSDIERLEVSTNDPTNLCSSPLDEIRLKHMKEIRDKNVTKRQN